VVGRRSFLVQHRCSRIEREIVFTDWRMVEPRVREGDMSRSEREPYLAPAAHGALVLASLQVRGAQPGRLILGRGGRPLLVAEERQSVIMFAPTETHKTSGLASPVLLEWPGPLLVTSVKGDLLSQTVARREQPRAGAGARLPHAAGVQNRGHANGYG
jgi:hypothetical protein